jgi:prophage tail gpP-like protein
MTEAVAISLAGGARFGQWSEVEIQKSIDGYTALSVSGPFDHERAEVRRAFLPLMFPEVEVSIGGELVLTARVKDVSPQVDPAMSSIGVTAYSLAHKLTEVMPDPALLPLEYNGLDLVQICDRLVTPAIGERAVFDGPAGAVFARVRSEPDRTIHSFLLDLAVQRAFVISDAPSGAPLFRTEGRAGRPVARLAGAPLVRVTPAFDPSSWFSSVTCRASRKAGKSGSRFTERNPLYRGDDPRFFTMRLDDTEAGDVPRAGKAAVGRMIAAVVAYTVDDLPGWRTPSGKLWEPNTTITLLAPEAMIYRETELLIRAVKFKQTPESETASLSLVLPGTFGGTIPEALPWDF